MTWTRVERSCLALACLSAALLACGCAEREKARNETTGTVELTYWPAPNAQEVELADSLVREWNLRHPDVHVVMQPIPVNQSTEEVLLAAIAGKTTPDICSNISPIALRDYVASGGLLPLDQFPDFDSVAAQRVPPELLRLFRTPDGHFYQVPWKTNPVMMFYNLRLLKSAGVRTVPRTYSDYYALGDSVLAKLNAAGKAHVWMGERDIRPIWWQRMFDVYPFYLAASGGMPLFRNDSAAFGNTSAEEVFTFFRTCYARGYFPRTSFYQSVDPFMLEKKVTHFAGPWQVAALRKFAPALDYAVSPIPVPDGRSGPVYTFGDFKNVAIFTTSKHPREAWAFVRFLLQAEFDRLLLRLCDQIPVRGDLLTNPLFAEYFRSNPKMVMFAEQIPFTRGMDSAPDMKEIFDGISQEYEMCAVYGRKAPAEAVRDAVERARTIMEWNR